MTRSSDGRSYPASSAQAAELTRRAAVEAYLGEPWSHNLALVVSVKGPFSHGAFVASVEQVLGRHESLRTGFSWHEKRPRQVVVNDPQQVVSFHELADLSAARARRRRVEQILLDVCSKPFLGHQTPKLRAAVINLGGDQHVVCVVADHIAADLWSVGVIASELTECYEAAAAGVSHGLPTEPTQYIDFVRAQDAAGTEERDLAFWRAELDGMGSQPALSLPGAKCQFVTSFDARVVSHRVPADICARVRTLKERHRLTTFGVWLSALVAYVFRETGQRDIGILMPVANRMCPQTRDVVGWLANQIIVRVKLPDRPTYGDILSCSWQSLLRALKHQAVACDDPRLISGSDQPGGIVPQVLLNMITDSEIPSMRFGSAQSELAPLPARTQRHVLDIRIYEGVLGASVAATYPVELYDLKAVVKAINGTWRSIRCLCDEPDKAVDASTADGARRAGRRSGRQTEGVA